MSTCTRPGCNTPVRARGLCMMHYQRWRRQHLNTVADPQDDPSMGFVSRHGAFIEQQAPEGLLTAEDRELLTAVVLTAAYVQRGVLPITPEMRRELLHKTVDAL
jgi:hypothetical protein